MPDERLRNIPGIGLQPVAPWADLARWLYCVTVDPAEFGRTREEVAALLDEAGIETRPFFLPLHRLPPYREQSQARREVLPVTDDLASRGTSLPTYNFLETKSIDLIADALRGARR